MDTPRTDTKTLIAAMRILARDIQSGDGVANAAIAEAADRMEEMRNLIFDVQNYFHRMPKPLCRRIDVILYGNEGGAK